jgi:hypothetical protein
MDLKKYKEAQKLISIIDSFHEMRHDFNKARDFVEKNLSVLDGEGHRMRLEFGDILMLLMKYSDNKTEILDLLSLSIDTLIEDYSKKFEEM